MRAPVLVAWVIALLALGTGCYAPDLEPCTVTCSTTSPCPDELTCGPDGYCHADDATDGCATAYDVTIALSGTGTGTVTSDVGGLGCAPLCAASIPAGTELTLTPSADASSRFGGWAGGRCVGDGPCTLTVDGPLQIGATFNAARPLNLTIDGSGGGQVDSMPAGAACTDDCVALFDLGAAVTLTATADATSRFGGWSQACAGSGGASCGVVLDGAVAVGATFVRTPLLTITPTGTGTGVVTSEPAGITCGATCAQRFDAGTSIALTASADAGSQFREWAAGGACAGSTDPVCTVVLGADAIALPRFVGRRTLTVHIVGDEGQVTGSLPCTATTDPCAVTLDVGTPISLDATGTSAWRFAGWSTPCTTGTCAFDLAVDADITATFVRQYALIATPDLGGSITVSPPVQTCTATCTNTYDTGTAVTLTATADAGHRFSGWTGACSGVGACNVAMTAARSVGATFVQTHTLTVTVEGPGSAAGAAGGGTIGCPGACVTEVDAGTTLTLTATADVGGRFRGITGCSAIGPTCDVTMDMDRSITVQFAGGKLAWSEQYGGAPSYGREFVEAVATDSSGRVVMAGGIGGGTTFDFGTGALSAAPTVQRAIMVARYSAAGVAEWAHVYSPSGASTFATASAVAIASDGDLLVGGVFSGALAIPGMATVTSQGPSDGFVLRLAAADGAPVRIDTFGGAGAEEVHALTVTSTGDLLVQVRTSEGGFGIGGGPALPSVGTPHDVLAALAPPFTHRWSRDLLPTPNEFNRVSAVVGAPGGDAVVVGFYGGVGPGPDLGGGALPAGTRVTMFIARLAAGDGAHVWSAAYGGATTTGHNNTTRPLAAALDPAGNLAVVGTFDDAGGTGAEDVSGTGTAPLLIQGTTDMFAATYALADGAHRRSFRFGSASATGDDTPVALAIAPDGDLLVAGLFTTTALAIGLDVVSSLGGNDVFIARVSNAGVGRWVRSLGSAGEERVTSVAASPTGAVVVGGYYLGNHAAPNTCSLDGTTFDSEDEGFLLDLAP